MHHSFPRLAATLLVPFVLAGAAGAGTWYVDPNVAGPGSGTFQDPYASLQYALVQASTVSGDTIEILPGTLFENVVHPQGKDHLRILSSAGLVVLDGMGVSSCYRLATTGVTQVTFEGTFRFTHGAGSGSPQGPVGGGLRVGGADLFLDGQNGDIEIVDCTASRGGGIFVRDGNLRFRGGRIWNNTALAGPAQGGGIHFSSSTGAHTLALEEASFVRDNAAETGGGVYVENAALSALFTRIESNEAHSLTQPARGGGVAAFDAEVHLQTEGWVWDNLSEADGGGLYLDSSSLSMSGWCGAGLNRAEAPQCSQVARGGGIWASCDSDLTGNPQCEVRDNVACHQGGGIFGGGAVTGVRITGNSAQLGGGVHGGDCDPTYTQCDVSFNAADAGTGNEGLGGGAYGPLHMTGCILLSNVADGSGGGAFGAALEGCTVESNKSKPQAFAPAALGGGLAQCEATTCTLRDNQAELGGGAAQSTLDGCTLELNRAQTPREDILVPFGGGAFACTLTDCVVAANRVDVYDYFVVWAGGGGAASSTLTGCTVDANVVRDNTFSGVNAANGGGLNDCTAVDCLIVDNSALAGEGYGGGVAGGSLVGCVVVGNHGFDAGGAAGATLFRCTVADNSSSVGLGNYAIDARNCILVGSASGLDEVDGMSTVVYSLVEGGFGGPGNLDEDPRFVDRAGRDFHLLPSSPCIDAGDPTTSDPDGTVGDMGAFPFDFLAHEIGVTSCTSNPNSTGQDALLATYGSEVVTDNLVLFRVAQLPVDKFGYMLMAANPDFVPLFGGGQGNLCLAAPQIRFQKFVLKSAPDGTVSFRPDLTQLPSGTVILPGEDWYFQFWHRDNNPQLTHNTSSAQQVLFQ